MFLYDECNFIYCHFGFHCAYCRNFKHSTKFCKDLLQKFLFKTDNKRDKSVFMRFSCAHFYIRQSCYTKIEEKLLIVQKQFPVSIHNQ
jgi:hypothetical protein